MQPERNEEECERLPDGRTMKTASEYWKHAQGCEVLAQQMPVRGPYQEFLDMAGTWEALATTWEGLVGVQACPT